MLRYQPTNSSGKLGVSAANLLLWLFLALLGYLGFQGFGAFFQRASITDEMKMHAGEDLLRPNYDLNVKIFKLLQDVDPQITENDFKIEYSVTRDAVLVDANYQRSIPLLITQTSLPLNINFRVDRRGDVAKVKNIVNAFDNSAKATDRQLQNQMQETK